MSNRASRIYIVVFIVLVLCIGIGLWTHADNKPAITKPYSGSKAVLSTPSQSTSFQIDDAVLDIPPRLPDGVQATIHTTAFTGSVAEGIATYSKTLEPIHFMAVKSNNKWVVIAHTKNKTLTLPNITVAKKYKLPLGWYSSETN